MTKVLKPAIKDMLETNEQTESLSKETEGIKRNQVEMLEMKKFNN